MKLMLNNVRIAFPALWEATKMQGSDRATYKALFLIDPKDALITTIKDAFKVVAKEKWGTKADAVLKSLLATDKVCLRDGNTKPDYEGFQDMMFVSTNSTVRPTVIDRDRAPLTQDDGKPYSGCYVNASIEIWAQDNANGKRINAQLRGVQFFRDGDAFAGGSRPASEDEFESLEVGNSLAD